MAKRTERSVKPWSALNFYAEISKDGTVKLQSPGPVPPGEIASIDLSIADLEALVKEAKDWSK